MSFDPALLKPVDDDQTKPAFDSSKLTALPDDEPASKTATTGFDPKKLKQIYEPPELHPGETMIGPSTGGFVIPGDEAVSKIGQFIFGEKPSEIPPERLDKTPYPGVLASAGKLLGKAGKIGQGAGLDVGNAAVQGAAAAVKAVAPDDAKLPDWIAGTTPPDEVRGWTENIRAALNGEKMPLDQVMNSAKGVERYWYLGGKGIVETAPKLAAASVFPAGSPAIIGSGAIFGLNEEGFDPVQGAIMAALPILKTVGGKLGGALADKFLASNSGQWLQSVLKTATGEAKPLLDVALKDTGAVDVVLSSRYRFPWLTPDAIKQGAQFAGAEGITQLYLDAVATVEALGLPPEQRMQAIKDAFASNLAFIPFAMPHLEGVSRFDASRLTDDQVAQAARVAKLINAAQNGDPAIRAQAMQKAKNAAASNGIKINFTDNLPDGERFDYNKPRATQEARGPETKPAGRSMRLLTGPAQEEPNAANNVSQQGSVQQERGGTDEVGQTQAITGNRGSQQNTEGTPESSPIIAPSTGETSSTGTSTGVKVDQGATFGTKIVSPNSATSDVNVAPASAAVGVNAIPPVDSHVLFGGDDSKVFSSIVRLIPVSVMDKLGAGKLSTEELRNDRTVFLNALSTNGDSLVAASASKSLKESLAGVRAKLLFAEATGRDEEIAPALKASDLSRAEVMRLFPADSEPAINVSAVRGFGGTSSATKLSSLVSVWRNAERRPTALASLLDFHTKLVSGGTSPSNSKEKGGEKPNEDIQKEGRQEKGDEGRLPVLTPETAPAEVKPEAGALSKPPAGISVSPQQWADMAKLNDYQQMEKYGTTRAKLLEEAVTKKPGRSLRTKKTSPPETKPVETQQPSGGLEKPPTEKISPVPKISRGDWIEWTDKEGKKQQAKVDYAVDVGEIIPGQYTEPRREYSTIKGTVKEGQNPKKIEAPLYATRAEMFSPDQLKGDISKEDHTKAVNDAFRAGKDVAAITADTLGVKPPSNYVKVTDPKSKSDLYVPDTSPLAKETAKPETIKSPLANLNAEDQAEAERLKKELQDLLREVGMGVDPRILTTAVKLANLYVKGGTKTFEQFAREVKRDMPSFWDQLKKYLRNVWNQVADLLNLKDVSREEAERLYADLDKPAGETEVKESNEKSESNLVQRPERAETGNTNQPAKEPGAGGKSVGGRMGGEQSEEAEGTGSERGPVGGSATSGAPSGPSETPGESSGGQSSQRQGDLRDIQRTIPPTVAVGNYTITDADQIGKGGLKQKFKDNIEAIKILKSIEAEKRPATLEEQSKLVRYVGWGGMKAAVFGTSKDWMKEHGQLTELLTPDEHEAARKSVLNAHYTSPVVIKAIYKALARFGFTGGKMVEGGAGIGHFIGLLPTKMRGKTSYTGIEKDSLTARIAALLYPDATIHHAGFEDAKLAQNFFDASAGNPPFGDTQLYDKQFPELSKMSIHNFFIAKTLALMRPGGISGFVVSRYFLDAKDPSDREAIEKYGQFLGAIRLPNTAFKENANTEVTTDIVFFRKWDEEQQKLFAKPSKNKSARSMWLDIGKVRDEETGRNIEINKHYVNNPDNMLGKMTLKGKMQGGEFEPTLTPPPGQDLAKELDKVIKNLPTGVYWDVSPAVQQQSTTPTEFVETDKVPMGVKVGGFFAQGGKVFVRQPDVNMKPSAKQVDTSKGNDLGRMTGMIEVKDALNELVKAEQSNAEDKDLSTLRRNLNVRYDQFVKKFGFLNSQTNRRLFFDDPESARLLGLETDYDPGVTPPTAKKRGIEPRDPDAKKAAIFDKRVNAPYREVTSVGTPTEALSVSLNQRGVVDIDYMAKLAKKTPEQVTNELQQQGLIFENPRGGWETRAQYLSGNVRKKHAEAMAAAKDDPKFNVNADELKAAIPADIAPHDITVPIGAPWIPASDVSDFARKLTGSDPSRIFYIKTNASWEFDHHDRSNASVQVFGTPRMPFGRIMKALLNGKPVAVYDTVTDINGKERPELNQEQTQLAAIKAADIKDRWEKWIWEDEKRRDRLHRVYNDTFNSYVDPRYDGSHLTLPWKSQDIQLRPHQLSVAWRTMTDLVTLYDHVVGAGKTFAGVAAFEELHRLGRVRKGLFVVPNHLVTQWRDDYLKLSPNANVLYASPTDFKKDNRQKLFAKIMTGDYNAIIIGHSSFKKIGMSPESEGSILREMVAEIVETIGEMKKGLEGKKRTRAMSQLEKTKERLEAKIKKLADIERDQVATFEELGIDGLFVDEAHEFKNLFYTTQMQNVAGLGDAKGSDRAFDLYVKTRYMHQHFGGKAPIVFATGTPISNSLVEMFTIQRYLQPKQLAEMGLKTLDAWAKVFGDITTVTEVDPTGNGYRMATRLAKFRNVGELAALYRTTADVITANDLQMQAEMKGDRFPVPKVRNGKPTVVVVNRTPEQAAYIGIEQQVLDSSGAPMFNADGTPVMAYPKGTILWRVDNMPDDPREDNMLKMTNDARQCGLDIRLIDPSAPDRPENKVNTAVRHILDVYKRWNEQKGTQLVFCDLSVPASAKGKATKKAQELAAKAAAAETVDQVEADNDVEQPGEAEEHVSMDELLADRARFSVYDDLKAKLIAAGIPADEVAFIHDFNTPDKKKNLFDRVNRGEVRVLMGSTAKMGAGTNVQKKLVAEHHMDAPWRPADLEQREGRIIRQGNEFYEAGMKKYTNPQDYDKDPNAFQVELYRYATKQSYDTRMWQIIENKARSIEGFRKADRSTRTIEDVSGEAANASEMKAAASGNPLIQKEIELRNERQKLESLQRAWMGNRHALQQQEKFLRDYEQRFETSNKAVEKALSVRNANTTEEFQAEIPGLGVVKDKALLADRIKLGVRDWTRGLQELCTYRGFNFSFLVTASTRNVPDGQGGSTKQTIAAAEIKGALPGNPAETVTLIDEADKTDGSGLVRRLDNWLNGFDFQKKQNVERRDRDAKQLAEIKQELAKPFTKEADLAKVRADHETAVQQVFASKRKPSQSLSGIDENTANNAASAFKAENPNAPEVQIINDAQLTNNNRGVQGDVQDGKLRLNRAFVGDEKEAMEVLREEYAHSLLDRPDVQQELLQLAGRIDQETLSDLRDQYGPDTTTQDLLNEWAAKVNRKKPSLFQRFIEAVRNFFRKLFGRDIPAESVVRSILTREKQKLVPVPEDQPQRFSLTPEDHSNAGTGLGDVETEGIETEVFGRKDTVKGRDRLTDHEVAQGADHARKVFENVGLQVFQQPNGLFSLSDPGFESEIEGRKLLMELKQQISDQDKPGKNTGYLGNLLNSIVVNMTQDGVTAFSPQLRRDLYAVAQGERSHRGLLLGALRGFGKTIDYVARNVDVVLNRVYSDSFGGERVRQIIDRAMTSFRSYFTDDEIKKALEEHPQLKQLVDRLIALKRRDEGGRVFQRAQNLLKPKSKKNFAQLEQDARVQEAVDQILENLESQGITPKPNPNKPLSPLERLILMVHPETAEKIQTAIEEAISQAERNAGIKIALRDAPDDDAREELQARFSAGEQPEPDQIKEGLTLPEYSHWQALRDNLLGYSPTTLKLARDLIRSDFKGVRFAPPSDKVADTKIDLNKLAKEPDKEIQRVLDAYYRNLTETVVLSGATPEIRQRIVSMVQDQVEQQLLQAKERARNPMFAEPKKKGDALTPEQSALQMINAGLFGDERLDIPAMVQRVSEKSRITRLVPTLGQMVKTVLHTPFYDQADLPKNFASELVNKFGISETESAKAAEVFSKAFQTRLDAAREKAAKAAIESLTPKEKRKDLNPKKPLWKRINEAVNAGVFDAGAILQKVAADHGWNVPDEATIQRIKGLSEQMDKLRTLTAREVEAIGNDPKLLEKARRDKEAATLEKRVAIKKQIETQWARFTKPLTPKTSEGRENIAKMINDLASANLLLRVAFPFRLGIDVLTQAAVHTPTRSIGEAIERWQNDRAAGRDTNLWREITDALGESYKARAKGVRNTLLAMRRTLAGTREAVNIDRVMTSISIFDRADEEARQAVERGDMKKAAMLRLFNLMRFGYRVAQALHNLQGIPAEYQENHARVVTLLRENGMNRAEAFVNADKVLADTKDEWQSALERAQALSDANGWNMTTAQLQQAALEIVMSRQYQRIQDLGLPADEFYERNRILSKTVGWGEAEVGGLGGFVANIFRGATRLGEQVGVPLPMFRFGNAIGISINRILTFTPVGFFEKAFGDSPFFRTEQDRRQRKVEAAGGTSFGLALFALAATGAILVRRKWPTNEAERELFQKEGHKVGTIEISTGDHSFIPISTTTGPLWVLQPYIMAGGAVHDLITDQKNKQAALDKEARAKGLTPGKVKPVDASTMLATAAEVAWQSITGGRTASGLSAAFTSYGKPDATKAVSGVISPIIPGLPAAQEISRMAGVSIDPKMASVWDFLVPLPTSGANRVNMLGDKVGNENDLQRVVQILTAGTYGEVDTAAAHEQQAYAVLYSTGYRPPSIDPNKGYEINGEFRPLTQSELAKYTEERAQKLKQQLSGLSTTAELTDVQAAYREANGEALQAVGAQVGTSSQTGSPSIAGTQLPGPTQGQQPLLPGGGSRSRSLRSGRSLRIRGGGGRVSSTRTLGRVRPVADRSLRRSSGGGKSSLRMRGGFRGPRVGGSLRVR